MLSITKMGPWTLSMLLSTLLIASANSSKKLSLNIIPSNGEIYLGEAKYFMCKASQEAELKWLVEDGEVEEEAGKFELKKVDETLIGLNITLSAIEDDQVLKCKAEPDSGEEVEEQIRLSIIQKPNIISDFGKKTEITAGSSVMLPCVSEGIPKPTISWIRNGEPVSRDQGHVSVSPNGSLHIEQIQLSDAGAYSCRASIDIRNERDQKTLSIIVNAAPVIRLQNDHLDVPSKSNTSLMCSVTGNPAPQVNWRRAGEPVLHDGEKYILSSNGQKLLILDLAKSDEGEYICNASNRLGMESATMVLAVKSEEKSLGAGAIAGILLVLFLVVMLAVDLTCYRTKRRGVLMYISTNLFGKSTPRVKLEETQVKKGSADKSHVVNISGIDA